MNDGFSWWLVVLGIAVGIGLVWLFTVRLPVSESDIDAEETVEEAGWISETIELWGGVAPAPLVQEVLELHHRYLNGDRSIAAPAGVDASDDTAEAPAADMADAVDAIHAAPADAVDAIHAAPADAVDSTPATGHAAALPATGASPASYAPPAYPPAGGFAEIPPPPSPRVEPE